MIRPHSIFRLLIAGLFAGSALAACKPVVSPPVTPSPASTRPASTQRPEETAAPAAATHTPLPPPHLQLSAESLRGVKITFLHPWTGELGGQIQAITAEFNESNVWGIEAEELNLGGGAMLYDHVDSTIGSDDAPNLVAAGMEQILAWQAQGGRLLNLNDYAASPQWGLNSQEQADFPQPFWQQGEVDGQRLGIPSLQSAQVLFYNQTWARELGFSQPPSTPEDFQAQACAAAKANATDSTRENDGTGGWIVTHDPLVALSWMRSFDLQELPDPGTGKFTFNRPPARAAYTFLRQAFDQNCAWVSRLPTPYEYFATRHALFYSGTLEEIAVQQRTQARLGSADEWAVLPYPAGSQKPVVVSSGTFYTVLASSREQQLASWLFIRWLTLPANQVRLVEAGGAWPASVGAIDLLASYRQEYPAWSQTLLWIPLSEPPPQVPGWRLVRSVLEDATWNMFQASVTPDEIPQILRLLDATIPEVLEKSK